MGSDSHVPSDVPLGKETQYNFSYDASLLFPIPRSAGREALALNGQDSELAFIGFDRWTAFELSWLNSNGQPVQRIAEFDFAADAPNIIESKSFKLYLNSLNQTLVGDEQALLRLLEKDLSQASGKDVAIRLYSVNDYREQVNQEAALQKPNARCLDELDVACSVYDVESELLTDSKIFAEVERGPQSFRFDGFRSLCPVTGQPDWASIYIDFTFDLNGDLNSDNGNTSVCSEGLLRYLVSFRNHQGFHEQCVEQIFTDLNRRYKPASLTVFARFLRRGGLDINPWRSSKGSGNLLGEIAMPVTDRQ